MTSEVQTAEQTALSKFVSPMSESLAEFTPNGKVSVSIRSDAQLQRAADALGMVRRNRKALEEYFKGDPGKVDLSPGQGLCYFARRTWDAANSLFKKFDLKFDETEAALDQGIKSYRAQKSKEAQLKAEREALTREIEAANAAVADAVKRGQPTTAKAIQAEIEASEEDPRIEDYPLTVANHLREGVARAIRDEQARITAANKPKAEAKKIIEQAKSDEVYVAPVTARVEEAPKIVGYAARKVWRAECTDLLTLCRSIANNPHLVACVQFNQSGANKLASAFNGLNAPAGLRFFPDEFSTTRRSR